MKRFLIIGALGMVVVAVAIGLNFWLNGDTPGVGGATTQSRLPPPPNPAARGSGIPVPAPPPVAAYRPGEPVSPTQTPAVSPEPKTGPPSEAKKEPPRKPEFEIVRINPEGDTVVAGRAAPGAEVRIYDGGALIGTVTADERGEWVYLPEKPLPEGKRELGLAATNPDGAEAESDSVVVLAVPPRSGASKTKAKKDAGAIEGPLAVLVQRDGSGPSRVLQKPTEAGGVRKGSLSVEIVDYDEAGNISIAGKGKPGTEVQVYLDNEAVGRATTTPEGEWRIEPDRSVSPGIYKLRADAISGGQVTARIEIPFSRADRVAGLEGESLVIVQPGNSLWRIARRTLGSGTKYTMIYDVNRAQILDPDLIYPGQVFALPSTN